MSAPSTARPPAERLSPRRPRRAVLAGTGLAIVAVLVVLVVQDPFGGSKRPRGVADNQTATSLATVTRRSLSSQTQVNATLGMHARRAFASPPAPRRPRYSRPNSPSPRARGGCRPLKPRWRRTAKRRPVRTRHCRRPARRSRWTAPAPAPRKPPPRPPPPAAKARPAPPRQGARDRVHARATCRWSRAISWATEAMRRSSTATAGRSARRPLRSWARLLHRRRLSLRHLCSVASSPPSRPSSRRRASSGCLAV